MERSYKISVPCSSANIGPGFDVLGLALSLYLELTVEEYKLNTEEDGNNNNNNNNRCVINYDKKSEGWDKVPWECDKNLITRTALYVLRCNGIKEFPKNIKLNVYNPIPLGRGLGSSGAAVVGGVMLGNEIGKLKLSKERMMDYILMIEKHPDNVTAAMMGGFVGSYLRQLSEEESFHLGINVLSESESESNSSLNKIYNSKLKPANHISSFVKYNISPSIKAIVVIPQFEVSTESSRAVLPNSYSRDDVVFNLQRLAVLTTALAEKKLDPLMIYSAMSDKIHQPYRAKLVPGLLQILQSMSPNVNPGLLGICLSGAGPTILALATENFDLIANEIIQKFKKFNVTCVWKLLSPAIDGSTVCDL